MNHWANETIDLLNNGNTEHCMSRSSTMVSETAGNQFDMKRWQNE